MKERYIKQVKNRLLLSREAEASVLAGLRESFASAAEHGEGEAETIARLGPPRQFADEVMADLGGESFAAGRRYLCLFYDNPAAGRIYHALGFADVGRFGMAMPE